MTQLNDQLYGLCREFIAKRIDELQRNIDDAQEAVNNETKNAAADNYEGGSELFQQEITLNLTQLNELYKQRQTLDQINTPATPDVIAPGSVVHTNDRKYYIAISAGTLKLNGDTYYAISSSSPIGKLLLGQKPGATVALNGKQIKIEKVE